MGLGGFLKNNWKDILAGGATVYGAVKGNQAQGQSNALTQQQIAQAEREYADRGPLRTMGLQGIGQSERPYDMGNLSYNDQNPFARARGPLPSNQIRNGRAGMGFTYTEPGATPAATPPPMAGTPTGGTGGPNQTGGMLPPVQPPNTGQAIDNIRRQYPNAGSGGTGNINDYVYNPATGHYEPRR